MNQKIKLATIFSGIGAIEYAFKKLNLNHEIVFACDIDKFVKQSYLANYPLSPNKWYEDVKDINGNLYKNQVDLFVGGAPCQSFSQLGKQKGLEDERGKLYLEFIRLVYEIQPKIFIFENVKSLIHHNKGKTFEVIKKDFETLGYHLKTEILNAKDFNIPQTRTRLFLIGFKDPATFHAYRTPPLQSLTKTVFDFLEPNPPEKYILSDKMEKYVLNQDLTPKYKNKVKLNRKIANTIPTKHQYRANITNYYSYKNKLRKLTPRECLRLMGFNDDFKIVVSDSQAYKQAGNSIVVNVLEALLQSIYNLQ